MSRPRFLFISGCNRSGTTWVSQLIDHHPHARVESEVGYVRADEQWIARDTIERWATSVPAGSYWRGWDIDRVRSVALRGAIESVWLDTMQPGPHVRIIGDKAPLVYGEAAEQTYALFPDSLYIDVVRDGRDVAVSRVFKALQQERATQWHSDREEHDRARRWYVAGERDGDAPSLFTVDSVRDLAHSWLDAIGNSERAASLWGDAFMRVRYEDLLDDTEAHTARMYRHLDLDDAEGYAEEAARSLAFERVTGRDRGEEDPAAFVRKGGAGGWREHFTPELHDAFREIAGDAIERLGYVGV